MKRALLLASLLAASLSGRAQAQAAAPQPLALSLREALLLSLENSPALKVQALSVSVTRTAEKEQAGAFDPTVSADVSRTWNPTSSGGVVGPDQTDADVGVSALLAPGTSVSADVGATWADDTASSVSVGVTQPLLRGAFPPVNLARVKQARIDTFSSRYQLLGFTSGLMGDVETAYWDFYLAGEQLKINRESLRLAEQQLEETRARVQVGRLAEIEIAAAEAEVASRRQGVLSAEGRVETARVGLIMLLNPPGESRWESEVRVTDTPAIPPDDLGEAGQAVTAGLRSRPDLAQARLAIERGDLELVRTRNGILPKLDLFFTGSAPADTLKQPDVTAGLRFEVPLGNQAASARNERAAFSRRQAEEALRNLQLVAEADIRTAHGEARLALSQIEATAVVQRLQEQKLAAETEKFRVGTSTTFLVAQAQRDLLNAQLAAVQASAGYLQALVRFYLSEGTLLQKRGVEVPAAP